MNETLNKLVREHAPESASAKLSFVKFNTAGSPKRAMPKVLFFCFYGTESTPRFVLKTVRSSRDNTTLARGFEDLKALSNIFPQAFPKPIWSGTLDGIAWSIESAIAGNRPATSDTALVVARYFEFQKNAARSKKTVPANEVAERLIGQLDDKDKSEARDLWKRIAANETVTLLPQHGDLTQDNVLVNGTDVSFIDTDWYMPEGIAGFDLVHFLSRASRSADAQTYLRSYREAIGMERAWSKADMFLWVMQERALKRMQGSPASDQSLSQAYEMACSYFGV